MREIKFRAWDKEKNKITLPFYIGDVAHGIGFFLHGFTDRERYEFLQYTGLKDKNGKEIYEGDILGWADEEYRENICVVEISLDGFRKIEEALCYSGGVVGNIYESPELLK